MNSPPPAIRPFAPAPTRRRYVDGRFGQVHLWEAGEANDQPALVCLHATAYSGQTFLPLMRRLAPQRHVIALDTPGYGGSDAPPQRVGLSDYATALTDAVAACSTGAVDLFGYHTGALLAAEMALQAPTSVRRLVLSGIPLFRGDDHAAWRSKLVHVTELSESFDQFRERWDYFITGRTPGLSLARAFDCFVDELRAYPRDWWAHDAMFDYDAVARLPQVRQPVRVINLASSLAAASRDAAALMPRASVVELPQLGGAPFDLGAELLAQEIEAFLGG